MQSMNASRDRTEKALSGQNPRDIFISGINLYRENVPLLDASKRNEIEISLLKMFDAVPDQIKRNISTEISVLDHVPLKIVRYLALKNIIVAKPILIHSSALTERDLLTIINLRGNPHRAAIAARKELTFLVSYKLVEKGNDEVIRILMGNDGASISQNTFKLAGNRITIKTELERIITSRNDISANSLEYLLGKFSHNELFNLVTKSNNKLKSIINYKMEDSSDDENSGLNDHSQTDEKLAALYELKKTCLSKDVTEKTLVSAIKSDENDMVICLFSILSELHLEEILEAISNADARKLAIASRAKNIKIDTVTTFLKSQIWETTLSNETVADAIRTYKSLKQNMARTLLNKQKALN